METIWTDVKWMVADGYFADLMAEREQAEAVLAAKNALAKAEGKEQNYKLYRVRIENV